MKHIQGQTYYLNGSLVGVITTSPLPFYKRSKHILVISSRRDYSLAGYLAVVSIGVGKSLGTPQIDVLESDAQFISGDIVRLTPKGEIIFLYEINSSSNVIVATERCNHHCIMCPQPPVADAPNQTEFNLQLISLMSKNTKSIGITGGEPTLIGDDLFVIIKAIQKRMPNVSMNLLTNGVAFSDRLYSKKLAACHCKDLQIDVPIFSDVPEEHNAIVGANTFYKTVAGLYNLAAFRMRICVRVVIHKQTYKRLPQLAEYIYRNFPFVAQVAFMELETEGLAKKNIDELWIDPFNYNTELREAVFLLSERGIDPLVYNAQLCVLEPGLRRFAVRSISEWKTLYLEECKSCPMRDNCGGFFKSGKDIPSAHIHKISSLSVE